jgi:WXG100 family type VII secretion target
MPNFEGSTIKVPPQLGDAANILNGRAAEMSAELNMLRNRVAALEGTWVGNARESYRSYQHMWDTAALNLFGPNGVLPGIAHVMNIVWVNYVEFETANTRGWAH